MKSNDKAHYSFEDLAQTHGYGNFLANFKRLLRKLRKSLLLIFRLCLYAI